MEIKLGKRNFSQNAIGKVILRIDEAIDAMETSQLHKSIGTTGWLEKYYYRQNQLRKIKDSLQALCDEDRVEDNSQLTLNILTSLYYVCNRFGVLLYAVKSSLPVEKEAYIEKLYFVIGRIKSVGTAVIDTQIGKVANSLIKDENSNEDNNTKTEML